jgi:hypothetical protein
VANSRRFGGTLLLTVTVGCGSATGSVDAGRTVDAHVESGPGDTGTGRADAGNPTHVDGSAPHADASPVDAPRVDASPGDAEKDVAPSKDAGGCAGGCPSGYTCGTANGIPVCRAASGIPLFSHIFIIMEENTSLSTLEAAMTSNAAPNFAKIQAKYASGTQYHGVTHPSLPNYIALTSGSPQGIACDCEAQPGQGTCGLLSCSLLTGSCTCTQSVSNVGDQLETAGKTWMAFGEGMGTPCNLVDDATTSYAVRHVPFLYYDDIQTNATRCMSHVVDFTSFKIATAPDFTYIAPNLIDDMHNPAPATEANITNGDNWIGQIVTDITASSAYKDGGLFVIVWDEDDDSGGITGTDDPVPIYVLSPYAKSGGYMSAATMDHYSLLATIEDGFNMPRLGMAGASRPSTADTLADYFPAE